MLGGESWRISNRAESNAVSPGSTHGAQEAPLHQSYGVPKARYSTESALTKGAVTSERTTAKFYILILKNI
jgi:hypothetical protein